MGKFRNIIYNITLALFSVLLMIALTEMGLRLMIPDSHANLFEYKTESDLYKVMKPNIRGTVYGTAIETNNMGFRDKQDWSPDKKENEIRLAVLGDSYTVSAGVVFEHIYTQRLEDLLRESGSAAVEINVLNLGVGGYNIVQYYHLLQEIKNILKPDYIILAIFPSNDFSMIIYNRNKAVAFGLEKPPRERGIESLYVYKAFGWKLKFGVQYVLDKLGVISLPNLNKTHFQQYREGWSENINALKSIAEMAAEENIPLLAVLLPHASNFLNQQKDHRQIKGVIEELGIDCLDIIDVLIQSGIPPKKFQLNIIDSHPNEKYNEIVARELNEYLKDRLAVVAGKEYTN